MGSVSTVGDFLDKFTALLKARSGLSGVTVASAWVAHGDECVLLGVDPIDAAGEYRTLPTNKIFEAYPVPGYIKAVKSGAGESAIKSVRDRAFALLEQVYDQLVVTSNTTTAGAQSALGVDDARITSWKLNQTIEPVENGRRVAEIEFVIQVSATFDPT